MSLALRSYQLLGLHLPQSSTVHAECFTIGVAVMVGVEVVVTVEEEGVELVVMKERRSLRRRSWLSKKEDVINNPVHSHDQPAKFNENVGQSCPKRDF